MSNIYYSLLQEVLNIGGELRYSADLSTGEIAAGLTRVDPFSPEKKGHAGAAVPLSTAHIRPRIEWNVGASLLKVTRGIVREQVGGGRRGKIKGFSYASRVRLMRTIAKIKRDAVLPMFVTLTYPNKFPEPMESKRHLQMFIRRAKRQFPDIGLVWKLEPQKRGAPHYHLLVWGVSEHDLLSFTVNAWYEIAGDNDHNHLLFHMGLLDNQPCVQAVWSREGVMRYASKYLGKTFEVTGWNLLFTGQFWGVIQPENIPFGEACVYEIDLRKANHIMRYQRRFARLENRSYPSITNFCDADQWIKNIVGEV